MFLVLKLAKTCMAKIPALSWLRIFDDWCTIHTTDFCCPSAQCKCRDFRVSASMPAQQTEALPLILSAPTGKC